MFSQLAPSSLITRIVVLVVPFLSLVFTSPTWGQCCNGEKYSVSVSGIGTINIGGQSIGVSSNIPKTVEIYLPVDRGDFIDYTLTAPEDFRGIDWVPGFSFQSGCSVVFGDRVGVRAVSQCYPCEECPEGCIISIDYYLEDNPKTGSFKPVPDDDPRNNPGSMQSPESRPSGPQVPNETPGVPDSIYQQVGLGRDSSGVSLGRIFWNLSTSVSSVDASSVTLFRSDAGNDVEERSFPDGRRQILSSAVLVDIAPILDTNNDGIGFMLTNYVNDSSLSFPVGGNPVATTNLVKISEVKVVKTSITTGSVITPGLRVETQRNGSQAEVYSLFAEAGQQTGAGVWVEDRGATATRTTQSPAVNDVRAEMVEELRRDPSTNEFYVTASRVLKYKSFTWGEELVSATKGAGAGALTSTYIYEEEEGPNQGKLFCEINEDGSWARYIYSATGRLIAIHRPWLDGPTGSLTYLQIEAIPASACIVEEYQETYYPVAAKIHTIRAKGVLLSRVVTTERWMIDPVSGLNVKEIQTETFGGDGQLLSDSRLAAENVLEDTWLNTGPTVYHIAADGRRGSYAEEEAVVNGETVRTMTLTHGTAAAPDGEKFRTLREVTVSGVSELQSQQTWIAVGGGQYAMLSTRTRAKAIFPQGEGTEEKLDGVVVGSAVRTASDTQISIDADGMENHFHVDLNTGVTTQTRIGLPIQSGVETLHNGSDLQTVTSYEPRPPVGGVTPTGSVERVTKVANGVSMLESLQVYDGVGNLVSRTDGEGRTSTYTYEAVADGGRRTTETRPGGVTLITESYRDGRLKSLTGTGGVAEYHGYDVVGGKLVETVRYGAANSPRWTSTVTDGQGRIVRQEKPSFGAGGVQVIVNHYNTKGQLVRVERTGMAPQLYVFDHLGELLREGLDLNGNGLLDLDSLEPVTEYFTGYENTDGGWWMVNRTKEYLTPTSEGGRARQNITRRRLGSGLTETVESFNESGWRSISVTVVDRLQKKRTATLSVTGYGDATETVINGLRVRSRRPQDGSDSLYKYDSFERLIDVKGPQGDLAYEYDEFGRLETETLRGGTANNMVKTYSYFGTEVIGAGQVSVVTASVSRMSPGTTSETHYAYDAHGRISDQWGPGSVPVHYVYDGYGDCVEMWTSRTALNDSSKPWENPANAGLVSKTYWIYDAGSGQLAKKNDHTLKGAAYTYHPSGLMKSRTWARTVGGQPLAADYDYDGAGRITEVDYSDNTPDVNYSYYRHGALRQMTDAAGVHVFEGLSAGGRPEREAVVPGVGSEGVLAGLQIRHSEDINGRRVGFQGSLTPVATNAVVLLLPEVKYTYDNHEVASVAGGALSVTYSRAFGAGQHKLILNRRSAWLSWPLRSTLTIDPALGAVEIQYGRVKPDAFVEIQKRTLNGLKIDQVDNYSGGYHPKKNSSWSYAFDSRGQVTSARKRLVTSSSPLTEIVLAGWDSTYSYDDIGNRIASRFGGDGEATSPVGSESVGYEVNALNQYTEIANSRAYYITGAAPGSTPPAIEVNGGAVNRAEPHYWAREVAAGTGPLWAAAEVKVGNGSIDVTFDRHLYVPPAVETLQYDEDGNLLEDGRWKYIWDAENRLVGMISSTSAVAGGVPNQKLTFVYDGRSRRIRKLVEEFVAGAWETRTDTRFVYDEWNLVAEVEYLGTAPDAPAWMSNAPRPFMRRTFLWGPDLSGSLQGAGGVGGLLAVTRCEHGAAAPKDYWVTSDLNGNIIGLVGLEGLEAEALYEYDPFGKLLRANEPEEGLNPFRFSTKYADAETGLVYYGYRYYDAVRGRWVNRDPIGERGGVNVYGMVGNDSVNLVDLLGLKTFFAIYYQNAAKDPGKSFKRAAETWEKDLLVSKEYDILCDKVILKGVQTKGEFQSAWEQVRTEVEQIKMKMPGNYKIKKAALFMHGGWETLYFSNRDAQGNEVSDTSLPSGEIESLSKLQWMSDAILEVRACNSARCATGRKAVIDGFADGQSIPVVGENGYADFSESPDTFYQVDKGGAGTSIFVYLKAFKKWSRKNPNANLLEGLLRRGSQNEDPLPGRTAFPPL